jgi:hypothetical protein
MSKFGYIGAIPEQKQYTNKGVFSVDDLYNLKNETPSKTKGDFITLDFVACGGGGGGGGGSFLHGTGTQHGAGGGAGEYLAVDNSNTYFKLGTTYAITIGAGGAGGASTGSNNGNGAAGSSGSNTTIVTEDGTKTLLGGGGAGGTNTFAHGLVGSTGGSGGGSGPGSSSSASGAASTASDGVGNAGGQGNSSGSIGEPGHGGGASAVGTAKNTVTNLPFGSFSLENLSGLGQPPARNGFFVDWVKAETTARGSTLARGGGSSSTSNQGIANTGHGGMGNYGSSTTPMAGGSGIVAFRYPSELTITAASATVTTATVGDYKITEVTASSGGTVRWD